MSSSRSSNQGLYFFLALLLALAPFQPEPHLVEKLRMLFQGRLSRPLDIFDLCLHGLPLLAVSAWILRERFGQNRKNKG